MTAFKKPGAAGARSSAASPPAGGGNPVLKQVFIPGADRVRSGSVTAPAGSAYVFAEVLAHGGDADNAVSTSVPAAGGGGGANDRIFRVSPGQSISYAVRSRSSNGGQSSTITVGGVTITANPGVDASGSQGSNGAGGGGKYAGGAGSSSSGRGGNGAGRFGALGHDGSSPSIGNANEALGLGAGAVTSAPSGNIRGGVGCACFTFFTTYDAAVAFAKAAYNGNWS